MVEWQALWDGALVVIPLSCHSRSAEMDCLNHWIPACAGMTRGCRDANKPILAPAVIPAKAGIQEGEAGG